MKSKVSEIETVVEEVESATDSNRRVLQQVLPDAFSDGRLDLSTLLQLIGQTSEDVAKERFGLQWHGKRDARQAALDPSLGTLRPSVESSASWGTTSNLVIDGDNLEVLKLLQKSFYNKVKVIYIDPPYNTGNDFVYRDNYRDSIANYLAVTKQTSSEGLPLTSATESAGRLHTSWLNMMYPRLRVARNLLRADGVLFMSIDEREVANARLVLSEIFGEHNAVGEFVWHAKRGGGSDKGGVITEHEYVLCFARDATREPLGSIDVAPETLDKVDEVGPYRRGRELNKWGANSLRRDRETMFFPIPGPNGEDVYPIRNDGKEGCWRRGVKSMMATVARGDADFVARGDGTFTVYEKVRSTAARAKPHRTLLTNVGQTADGTKAIKALFDGEKVFAFAKPPALIKALIEIAAPPEPDDDGDTDFIVMDFFAGSGTTAEAVMELNAEDDAERRFVLVQLPEALDPKSPTQVAAHELCVKLGLQPTISEVMKERVRRAGQSLRSRFPGWCGDVGFRVFALDSSNLRVWDPDVKDLEASLLESLDHIKPDRADLDLLFEVMLRLGVDPSSPVESRRIANQEAFVVAAGPLVASLSNSHAAADVAQVAADLKEIVDDVANGREVTVVLKDSSFHDEVAKANLIAALLQSEISNVRTI